MYSKSTKTDVFSNLSLHLNECHNTLFRQCKGLQIIIGLIDEILWHSNGKGDGSNYEER